VCTLVHGIASVRAVEDALQWSVPANAQLIRNLMVAAQHVHDHVMHFYHLHALDWVDVVSALKADPKATVGAGAVDLDWPESARATLPTPRSACGSSSIAASWASSPAYWGHPAYRLPPEANLMAVAHYLEALAWQRDVVKLHAIFGGKNPHPNFLVGGSPSPVSASGQQRRGGHHAERRHAHEVRLIIRRMQTSSTRSTCPTRWPSPASTRTGSRAARALGNFLTWATSR
jgi:hydrogenase large subunit